MDYRDHVTAGLRTEQALYTVGGGQWSRELFAIDEARVDSAINQSNYYCSQVIMKT